jgi:RES domain-containing protein
VISLYRLSSARFPVNNGAGAAKYGGRWNQVGRPVIYAAQTASLAALEVLVHYSILPRDFLLTEIQVPDNMTTARLEVAALPMGWDGDIIISRTQVLGEQWVVGGRAAVLSVPSSIVPKERNFVINPVHPSFRRIKFLPSAPFAFDPRLKR